MTNLSIIPARSDQKGTIANLIQHYLYDMTEFMPFPFGADGRFQYDFLDRFWQHPYFIMAGDEIAGFALVVDSCPLTGRTPCWFMAEFFVLKAYRRRGAGQAALVAVLARHPGDWHIAVPHANQAAASFWQRVIADRAAPARDISFEGDDWRLYSLVA